MNKNVRFGAVRLSRCWLQVGGVATVGLITFACGSDGDPSAQGGAGGQPASAGKGGNSAGGKGGQSVAGAGVGGESPIAAGGNLATGGSNSGGSAAIAGSAQGGAAGSGGNAQGGSAQGGSAPGGSGGAQGGSAQGGSAGAQGGSAQGGSAGAQGGSAQGGSAGAQGGSAQGGSAQGGSAQGGSGGAQGGAGGAHAGSAGAQGGAGGSPAATAFLKWDDGYIDGASNTGKVKGYWYTITANGTISESPAFSGADAAICVYGNAAQMTGGNGPALGFNTNQALGTSTPALAWNATTNSVGGIEFVLTGSNVPASIQVDVKVANAPSDTYCALLSTVATGAAQTLSFGAVLKDCRASSGSHPAVDRTQIQAIHFLVPTSASGVTGFNFCVTSIKLL